MAGWFFSAMLALIGLAGIGLFRDRKKRKKLDNARNYFRYWFAAGVLVSATILIFPIQQKRLAEANAYWFQVHISSLVYAMQLFTLNVEYKELPWVVEEFALSGWAATGCAYLLTLEFVIAPLLTFTIVLSFFRNVSAWYRRIRLFWQDIYVFSELNDRSLVLAESIHAKDRNACLIFTDVNEDKEEELPEYRISRARKMKAACYKQDILSVNLNWHSKNSKLTLYLIGDENKSENIVQAMELIDRFRDNDKCRLYIFSSRAECEFLLNKKEGGDKKASAEEKPSRITVRRINAISSLINRTLSNSGCELLYETAVQEGDTRKISAVLVGLGQHGMEMLKALVWYCRMYGYTLEINAFDKDPDARKKLAGACPKLIPEEPEEQPEEEQTVQETVTQEDPAVQKKKNDAGAGRLSYCHIEIHPGLDAENAGLAGAVEKISNPTYILVALGNDELNIRTAAGLRAACERNGSHPVIQAIVYNSKESRILDDINNHKKQKYDIDFIGDVASSYTENVLINSELEDEAKLIHTEYAPAGSLFDYEYNYRSSCASAIHAEAVAWKLMDIPKGMLNTELLKRMEYWLRLAYRVCDPEAQVNCTLTGEVRGALELWAEDMRNFAKDLITIPDFSFQKWENGDLISGSMLAEKSRQVIKLFGEYGHFAELLGTLDGKPEDDLGLWKPFTLKNLLENSTDSDQLKIAAEPGNAVRHALLTIKLMMLEHERWMAYQYTIGYRYGEKRNDLGKIHHDLVAYEDLKDEEKGKDLHLNLMISRIPRLEARKNAVKAAAKAKTQQKEAEEAKADKRETDIRTAKEMINRLREEARKAAREAEGKTAAKAPEQKPEN